MIKFVNAKINIGLQIVSRRPDGFHNLQTLFYPVGLYAGTPGNPVQFCDVLEVVTVDECDDFTLTLTGNPVDCPIEKNLVWRAARLFFDRGVPEGFKVRIVLDKHLPDGAGLGGGSADASFTLRTLAELAKEYAVARSIRWEAPSDNELEKMAFSLGADCPFFIYNRPAYAEGAGEKLAPVEIDLSGYWIVIVKPDAFISTKEAFAGVIPFAGGPDLREILNLPPEKWRKIAVNDFEKSIFPKYPAIDRIKDRLYESGALYASLTGSGACVYGIFSDRELASEACIDLQPNPTIKAISLLKL